MTTANKVSARYDHPEYLISRECQYDRVAITASTLKFACFHARVKMYVANILVAMRSIASLAALTCIAYISDSIEGTASAIAGTTIAWISATSVANLGGSIQTIALNLTLNADQFLSLGFSDAKGKVFVEYQYTVLPS